MCIRRRRRGRRRPREPPARPQKHCRSTRTSRTLLNLRRSEQFEKQCIFDNLNISRSGSGLGHSSGPLVLQCPHCPGGRAGGSRGLRRPLRRRLMHTVVPHHQYECPACHRPARSDPGGPPGRWGGTRGRELYIIYFLYESVMLKRGKPIYCIIIHRI